MWFFFFKQKTAYEMRISDWSSDVCSSDLRQRIGLAQCMMLAAHRQNGGARRQSLVEDIDLRTLITAELQGEQRQQDRFARAGRPDNELMADITDMGEIGRAHV